MDNLLASLSEPKAPYATAPPMSFGSFNSATSTLKNIQNVGNTQTTSSSLKITSWLLFVVSLIFSIIFA